MIGPCRSVIKLNNGILSVDYLCAGWLGADKTIEKGPQKKQKFS